MIDTTGVRPAASPYDVLVFVGRFQPFHLGHLAVIREALGRAAHVLVLVGSANASRSERNPFTYEERRAMIVASVASLEPDAGARTIVRPIDDHLYNDAAWIEAVQAEVARTIAGSERRVGIIGHAKDRSSYYLRVFPRYAAIDVDGVANPFERSALLGSTTVRELVFDTILAGAPLSSERERLVRFVPEAVARELDAIARTPAFAELADEVAFVRRYRARWDDAPYAPTFNTVDAVVHQAGQILMVVRGERPGRGRLALPGGFVDPDETLVDACLRELHEETQIDVPRRVLLGALRDRAPRTFDDPFRSTRGRTFTHAFRFDLGEKRLPKVKGSDDARHALWVPLAAIDARECFEDHAHIVRAMMGVG